MPQIAPGRLLSAAMLFLDMYPESCARPGRACRDPNGTASAQFSLKDGGSLQRVLRRHMRVLVNLWPPFLGAGIRVKRLQPDWKHIDVEMKLHFWNTSYVGTHYGGSLYSMTDPFFMLMLIENL